LVSYPPPELAALHNATLANESAVRLAPNLTHAVHLPPGTGAAVDIEVTVALPSTPSAALHFALQVLAPTEATTGEGVTSSLHIAAAAADGTRNVTVNGQAGDTFVVLRGEETLHVRALVDRSIVEVFFAGGRASVTTRAYPALGESGVRLISVSGATVNNVVVHEMGCGWVDDA
jgi:sucrose-6-phosphate hydrolase SacC (GH32 family)